MSGSTEGSTRVCPLDGTVLIGAVAQLGERRVRNAKVGGSSPLGSTIHSDRRRVLWRMPPFHLDLLANARRRS